MDNAEPNPAPQPLRINYEHILRLIEVELAHEPQEQRHQMIVNIIHEAERQGIELVQGANPEPIADPQMRENVFDEFYVVQLIRVLDDLEHVHGLWRDQPEDHRVRTIQFLTSAEGKLQFIRDVIRMCVHYHENVLRVLDGEEGRKYRYYQWMLKMNDAMMQVISHVREVPEIGDCLMNFIRNELATREGERGLTADERRRRRIERFTRELNGFVPPRMHQVDLAQIQIVLSQEQVFNEAYEEEMRLVLKDLVPVQTSLRRQPQDRQLALEENLTLASLRIRIAGCYARISEEKLVGIRGPAEIQEPFRQYYREMARTITQKAECVFEMIARQRDEELLVLVVRQINSTKNELNARRLERNLPADEQRRRRIDRYRLGWNREENWVLEIVDEEDRQEDRQENQQEVVLEEQAPNRRRPHPDFDMLYGLLNRRIQEFENRIQRAVPVPNEDNRLAQALQAQQNALAQILGDDVGGAALPAGEQDAEVVRNILMEQEEDDDQEDQADGDDDDEEAEMVHFQGTTRRIPESVKLYLPPNKNSAWIHWNEYDVMEWSRQFLPEVVDYLVPLEMDGRGLYNFVSNPNEWCFDKMPLGYYLKLMSNLNRVINDYNHHTVQY
ncbi:hypothetical protein B9Z55_012874 [Caenorhabditis nigoni]|uniref:Uncharacterized protein n=1 Tax=Caenorhabditis nigoni TaxID=1611254 RepID=A0A2G5TZC6_9PELO|nr:hypothetical protein B9Z55_012874 [Caenorhabditis nigoni]